MEGCWGGVREVGVFGARDMDKWKGMLVSWDLEPDGIVNTRWACRVLKA